MSESASAFVQGPSTQCAPECGTAGVGPPHASEFIDRQHCHSNSNDFLNHNSQGVVETGNGSQRHSHSYKDENGITNVNPLRPSSSASVSGLHSPSSAGFSRPASADPSPPVGLLPSAPLSAAGHRRAPAMKGESRGSNGALEGSGSNGRDCLPAIRRLARGLVSVSSLTSAAIFTAGIVCFIVSATLLAVTSLEGAQDMAKTSSRVVSDGCSERLSATISSVTEAADLLQFSIGWDVDTPLPSQAYAASREAPKVIPNPTTTNDDTGSFDDGDEGSTTAYPASMTITAPPTASPDTTIAIQFPGFGTGNAEFLPGYSADAEFSKVGPPTLEPGPGVAIDSDGLYAGRRSFQRRDQPGDGFEGGGREGADGGVGDVLEGGMVDGELFGDTPTDAFPTEAGATTATAISPPRLSITPAASSDGGEKLVLASADSPNTTMVSTTTRVPLPSGPSAPPGGNGNANANRAIRADWYLPWHKLALMHGRGNTFGLLNQLTLAFSDGSYAGCVADPRNGSQVKCVHHLHHDDPSSSSSSWADVYHNVTYYYAGSGLATGNTSVEPNTVDPRGRPWYTAMSNSSDVAVRGVPYAKRWEAFSVSPQVTRASAALAFNLVNRTGHWIGVGSFNVGIASFSTFLQGFKPSANAHLILLGDEGRTIIASTLPQDPYSRRDVAANYTLDAAEAARGCMKSDYSTSRIEVFCPIRVEDVKYAPFAALVRDHAHLFNGTRTQFANAGEHQPLRLELDGSIVWTSVTLLSPRLAPNVGWRVVLLFPEDDITADIYKNVVTSVAISAAVVVVVLALFMAGLHFMLRPLAHIAERMRTAEYLLPEEEEGQTLPSKAATAEGGHEAFNDVSSSSDVDDELIVPATSEQQQCWDGSGMTRRQRRLERARAAKEAERARIRRASALGDIAAIQQAYWAMVDELRALRGYIPQHICEEVVKSTASPAGGDRRALRTVSNLEGSARNTTDKPSSAAEKQQRRHHFLEQHEFNFEMREFQEHSVRDDVFDNVNNDVLRVNKNVRRFVAEGVNAFANDDRMAIEGGHDAQHRHPIVYQVELSDVAGGGDDEGVSAEAQRGQAEDGQTKRKPSPVPGPRCDEDVEGCVDNQSCAISMDAITAEVAKRSRYAGYNQTLPPTIYFRDNALIDRDISVACVNIVGFHQYAVVTHGADVTRHHEALVAYMSGAATRCGGVLDTFSGDKFWVSFNATTRCDGSAVAAACFGYDVASTVNKEAAQARAALTEEHALRMRNEPVPCRYKPKFRAALRGVTVGLATGRAFVGPLGTSTIRRHSIISNALPEAAALERQCGRYPDCGVLIGGDMIPAIEGYAQYLLLDACVLPGSGGMRRRLASVKGIMCAAGCDATLLRGPYAPPSSSPSSVVPPPSANPYATTNAFFNAFLEGRNDECVALMTSLDTDVMNSAAIEQAAKEAAAAKQQDSTSDNGSGKLPLSSSADESSEECNNRPSAAANAGGDGAAEPPCIPTVATLGNGVPIDDANPQRYSPLSDPSSSEFASSPISPTPDPVVAPTPPAHNPLTTVAIPYTLEQRNHVVVMLRFVYSLMCSGNPVDGRVYRSPFSSLYLPTPQH